MERIVRMCLATALALSAAACGVSEFGDFVKDESNGVWVGPSSGGTAVSQSTTYVTAFDYPEGYDWRRNPEKGSVRCSLVVFADDRPVLKVPVGDVYSVSDDPDMHRVIDGHLYTDFAADNQTVIKKDGKPFLSFEGRESVEDMIFKGDTLHLLCHKRGGKGFTYRVNGEPVLERDNGYTFSRLICHEGSVFFAFSEQILSSEGNKERYYCFMNGAVEQTALREDVKKVWDVSFHKGAVCCLASLTGIAEPVLISKTGLQALPLPYGTNIVSGQVFSAGDAIGVEMILSSESAISSALWLDGRLYQSFASGAVVSSIWTGDAGVACILNPRSVDDRGSVFRMGEIFDIPEEYSCFGEKSIDMADGMLTVGLSSLAGNRPLLWKDGDVDEVDVNGYICTVSSVVPL
jgi:hypothetical protein